MAINFLSDSFAEWAIKQERELRRLENLKVILYFDNSIISPRTGKSAEDVANILIEGSNDIPKRDFIEVIYTITAPVIERSMHKAFEKVVDGMSAGNALRFVANIQKKQAIQVINNAKYYGLARNADSTISNKGFDQPLVEAHSVLIPALRSKVVKRK